ncbi:MAG: hypothetical protein AB1505_14575 [Candidatus Latescibacterota bacterium]
MDFATRRFYYNRCKPFEELDPSDERNLDVDRFGRERVRGINWVEKLASRIEYSDEPVFELYSGLPGSGKSTELRRLAQRLASPQGAHLLPVRIDAEDAFDLANPIDIPDIIAAIVHAADEAVLQAEGKDPGKALEEGYLQRLWTWLQRTDFDLGKAEYAIPEGPKLVVEMRTRPTLRARVRAAVAAHLTTFLREARDELILQQARAERCGYRGLVVMVDSLEKLRGITTNWTEVLGSAERVFGSGAPYLRLPVHVLYTVPAALVSRFVGEVEFMPMIKLHERDGGVFAAGYAAAREIIRRRIPDEPLCEILGNACEERVRKIIELSGGYPREIVRLLQNVVASPEYPLPEDGLGRIFNEVRDGYRKAVPAEAFPWLAQVAVEHYLTIQNEDHRRAADLMLSLNAVMRYLNSQDWFCLHPAVEQIPGVQAAIEALRQGAGG